MTPRRRPTIDVSGLPSEAFGHHDVVWWGTLGFVVIEGFTLVLCAVVHVYLRQNFDAWPPEGTLLPSRVVPTIQVLFMLSTLPLMYWLELRARAYELRPVRLGITAAAACCAIFNGLRAWELTKSVNVRWDANAYGSAQWLVIGAHATLLAIQLVEIVGITLIFWLGPIEKKHFSDVADASFYWFFIVLAWIPLYALCFLAPYWI